jgi:hypothetical protein
MQGDYVKGNEIGGTCSTHGRDKKHIKFWSKNLKERDLSEDLGVDGRTIRLDLKGIAWEDVDWIRLTQDRDQRERNFLPSWVTISFSRTTLPHGVSTVISAQTNRNKHTRRYIHIYYTLIYGLRVREFN